MRTPPTSQVSNASKAPSYAAPPSPLAELKLLHPSYRKLGVAKFDMIRQHDSNLRLFHEFESSIIMLGQICVILYNPFNE